MVETLKKVKAAGVPIAFGSDTNPPGHGKQSSQFKHYVEYGLTPAEALNTAFMGAANVLNYDWAKQVGSIEKGSYADIIGVAGDPLKDVSEMERVKFVMKGGVVVKNELTTPAPTRRRRAEFETGRKGRAALAHDGGCHTRAVGRMEDSMKRICVVVAAAVFVLAGAAPDISGTLPPRTERERDTRSGSMS